MHQIKIRTKKKKKKQANSPACPFCVFGHLEKLNVMKFWPCRCFDFPDIISQSPNHLACSYVEHSLGSGSR
jgi:hypothetical protein